MLEIGGVHLDDHGAVRRVVADPVDKTASGCLLAGERLQVYGSAIFHIDGLGVRPGRAGQANQEYRQSSR
jgi:hypothetical protein